MNKKVTLIWALILTLVVVSVPFGIWRAMASDPPYKMKILEIVDNPTGGTYALSEALKGTDNIVVETMRMKKFVAMRDELDGKYDAIYFGAGSYSTLKPASFTSKSTDAQSKAHNTTEILNDITKLKVKEITEKYVARNLPVIFNTAIESNQASGELRNFYNTYLSQPASSVSYVGAPDSDTFKALVNKIKTGDALFRQRPQLEVTSKPADFTQDPTKIYTTGDTLTFNFNANYVKDFSSPVNVTLYASVDKVLPMTAANVVASKKINQQSGTVTYTLPQTFSGPVYWRLVLSANNQSDYVSGAFRVRDQKTSIRVLQVMPNNENSKLTLEGNMNQTFLKSDDYDITITPVLFKNFVATTGTGSYKNLNGQYDMLIFGFTDSYNINTNEVLSDAAATAVQNFIRTGQAVMFTHDTVYMSDGASENQWTKFFQELTGQIGYKNPSNGKYIANNLGLGAPVPSTFVKMVNSGMLTQFPFNLTATSGGQYYTMNKINQTHDQYFMLDLEDPEVIPWYNIQSETKDASQYQRDIDDSYDHYYTYSKGNVTYSGTGHVNTGFPEWEQKLFVNTMFRAFIGSNHAPTIQVVTPEESDRTLPSYLSDLSFSYKANDLDLKDMNLTSSVRVSVNGLYRDDLAIAKKRIGKGEVVRETFQNPLPVDSGKIQIEITVADDQGAQAVQTIDLTIEKKEAVLKTERTILNANAKKTFKVDESVRMSYVVTPQPIELVKATQAGTQMQKIELSKVKYTETLPPNLDFAKNPQNGLPLLPEGVVIDSGNADTGYVISKTFTQPITYTLAKDQKSYQPDDASKISFELTVIPKKTGSFILNQARLSYVEPQQQQSQPTVSDPSALALNVLKNYSLVVTGNEATAVTGGTIKGRAMFNPPTRISSPDIGAYLPAYDASLPTVITNNSLDISTGSISKGPIVSNGDITISQFGIKDTTVISKKNLSFSGNGGANASNSSLFAGGNFFALSDSYTISNNQIFAVGNLTLNKQKLGSGSALYGGTIDNKTSGAVKDTPASIQNKLNQKLASMNINDFATVAESFSSLSKQYANMTANGEAKYEYGNLSLNGPSSTLNVFNINGDTMKLSNTTITVPQNSNATVIINISGSTASATGGFSLQNTTSNQVLINYTGTGTLSVSGIHLFATILAPNGKVDFQNGQVDGSIVANKLAASAYNMTLNNVAFAGKGPDTPTPTPAPTPVGTPQTIRFPNVDFEVPILVSSVRLQDNFIWVNDTLTIPAEVLPADATDRSVTWTTDNPAVLSIVKDGITSTSTTVVGLTPGVAKIRATANDGSGQYGEATITVAAAPLSIDGSHDVNVNNQISDLVPVLTGNNMTLTNIRWSLAGGTTTGNGVETPIASLVKASNGNNAILTGKDVGSAEVTLTATVIKTNDAGAEISRRDWTATSHMVNVHNPFESVALDGPNWVAVTKTGASSTNSIPLTATINPSGSVLQSVVWSVTEGANSGSLVDVSTNGTRLDNTLNSLSEPGKVTVHVVARSKDVTPATHETSKDIRVVDVSVGGPDAVYFTKPTALDTIFHTFEPETWTEASGKPSDYSWTIENLVKDTDGNWIVDTSNSAPYAQLSNANTASPTLTPNANGVEGSVKVTVTVGGMTASKKIDIKAYLINLSLPTEVPLTVGQNLNLNALLNLQPGSLSSRFSEIYPRLTWTTSDKDTASVVPGVLGGNANDPSDKRGIVTGQAVGTAKVTVTYTPTEPGFPVITTSTTIRVTRTVVPTDPDDPDNPGGGVTGDNLY